MGKIFILTANFTFFHHITITMRDYNETMTRQKGSDFMTQRTKKMIAMVFGLALTMTILGAGFAYAASEDVAPADDIDEAADTQIRDRAGEVVRDGFEALTDEQKAEIYALTDDQETLREKVQIGRAHV